MILYSYITLITTLLVLINVIFIPFIPPLAKGILIGSLSIISIINLYIITKLKTNSK